MRSRFVAALTLPLLLGAVAQVAERYPIKLSRAYTVGDRFTLKAKGSTAFRQTIRVAGQVAPGEQRDLRIELEAEVAVLEVDANGRILRQELTVQRMVYGESGQADAAVAPGQRIIAESSGIDTRFRLSEGSLPELAGEVLSLVAGTAAKELPTDDQAFGTDEPRAIGESWPIDRAKSAEAWAAVGLPVDADAIRGNVIVEGLEKLAGVDCLRIKASMAFEGFSIAGLEPGTEVEAGNAEMSFSRLYPTDLESRLEHDVETLHMSFRIRVTEGELAGAVVDTTSDQAVEISVIPAAD